MTYPTNNETKKEYITRFMGNKEMVAKYPNQKQRYVVALSHWNKRGREVKRNYKLEALTK